jgi:tetratricopeptide (TPR) repeat protein
MAINAKNSIHDSPELHLNVIRAGVDYAATLTDGSSKDILNKTEHCIHLLEKDYDDIGLFKEQIIIAKARIHNAKDERVLAERLINTHVTLKPSVSIEDNLDKVKVFHEIGQREEAIILLDAIKKQIAGDSLTSQVVNKYVEQETEEREEIHFTPKQLNKMAVEFYKKNKMEPALNALVQALQLSPKNANIAISLLKVLLTIKLEGQLMVRHFEIADSVLFMMDKQSLIEDERNVYLTLKQRWLENIESIRPKQIKNTEQTETEIKETKETDKSTE